MAFKTFAPHEIISSIDGVKNHCSSVVDCSDLWLQILITVIWQLVVKMALNIDPNKMHIHFE